ncbi:hypothetical protein OROHE_011389 [Orobanche hederae]
MEEEKGEDLNHCCRDSTETVHSNKVVVLNNPGRGGERGISTETILKYPNNLDECQSSTCKLKLEDEDGDFKPLEINMTPPPSQAKKDGWTLERSNNGHTKWIRYVPGFVEVTYYKGEVAIKGPGIVAAVGGIPDELKINDGISFSIPSPIFKFPTVMPSNSITPHDLRIRACRDTFESDAYVNTFVKAYMKEKLKALGISITEEEAHNIRQQSPTMLEFNIAVSPGYRHYLRYDALLDHTVNKRRRKKATDPQLAFLLETESGATFLYRQFGDLCEAVPLNGILDKRPGFIAAVGGIPNEQKLEGALTFWYPYPVVKYPINKKYSLHDPRLQRFGHEYYLKKSKVLQVEIDKAFQQAYEKARSRRSSSTRTKEIKAHSKNPLRPMVEVNVLVESGQSASDELNKTMVKHDFTEFASG